jgi:hypothetical protein
MPALPRDQHRRLRSRRCSALEAHAEECPYGFLIHHDTGAEDPEHDTIDKLRRGEEVAARELAAARAHLAECERCQLYSRTMNEIGAEIVARRAETAQEG